MHPGGGHVEEGVIVGGAPIGHRGGRIVDAGDGDRDGGAGAAAVAVRGGVGERVGGGGSNRERVEHPVRIVAVGAVGVQLQQRPGGKGDGGTDVGGRAGEGGDYQQIESVRHGVFRKQLGSGHVEEGVLVAAAPTGHTGGFIVVVVDGVRDAPAGAAFASTPLFRSERVGGGGSNRERVEHPVRVVAVGAVGVQLQQRPGGKGDGGTDVGGRAVDRGDYRSEERRGGSVVGCQGGGGHQECSVDGRATSIEPRGG